MSEHPELLALRARLEQEEAVYAELLAAVDTLASFPLPQERQPELPARMARLNELWSILRPPARAGLGGAFARRAWAAAAPSLQRQAEFNSALVEVLNGHLDETARLHAHLRNLVAALVRYLQRLLPVIDARDRVVSALSTTRSELILEAFDRRQESLARRLEGLLALRDRVEALGEQVGALRAALDGAGAPPPTAAADAARAAEDAAYGAFENLYRGSRDDIAERLSASVALFDPPGPVVDLGCGRGEFLEALRERGIQGRGVESNRHLARQCRQRGLDVSEGDLVAFLRAQGDGSLGGIFASQVAEHLPPAALQALLRQSHRALRPGGLLVLETVNPRSALAFLEVYTRDLTHERPLHPDTLRFLAAAEGFTDVRVEMRAPVDAATRLQSVPVDGLPPRAAEALNENVARLNALLYAPLEYALLARR
jgi:O-antigen chain-terminating methyltransferase